MHSLNYIQIVTKPTFLSSGSLLDHVYTKTTRIEVTENHVVNIYYSDHDAVAFTINICEDLGITPEQLHDYCAIWVIVYCVVS